jgi:hypothetical protein
MGKGTSTAGTGEDYRNAKLDVEQRVDDLLDRMSLAEKAGMLFQTMIVIGSGDLSEPGLGFGVGSAEHMIHTQLLTHFNLVRAAEDAKGLAEWHNRLQKWLRRPGLASRSPCPRTHGTISPKTPEPLRWQAPSPSGPRLLALQRLAPLTSWNALPTSLGRNTWR